jgi:hypothetical protein
MRLLLVVLMLARISTAQGSGWTAAEFRGLKLGTAKMEDIQRVLGGPDTKSYKNGSDILVYGKKGDNDGNLELELRDGVLFRVTEDLPVAMPRAVAFRKYGKDYVERRYAAANCTARSGDDLLYRSSKGVVELLEYPKKGILLWPDQFGYDIASVIYRARPLATRKPHCTTLTGKQPKG